eukprot:TRINITY_DN5087_c0_g1_i1.p1 TRINITY_DN5087_c0_g1~~TRINITY_DN5087_c0_g1_i1.p1  ORF type:complete len:614 (-),score=78.92 TRINITY_DN5087_c0_g1_i1:73-1914(-)
METEQSHVQISCTGVFLVFLPTYMQCSVEDNIDFLTQKPDREALKEQLTNQGNVIRELKTKAGEGWQKDDNILRAVWKHLALKTHDEDLGQVPLEQRGPRSIKIRWRLTNDKRDKRNAIRFQNVFHNRFYLTGGEIVNAIQSHMGKSKLKETYGDQGGILKIEFIDKSEKPHTYIAIAENSLIRIPLSFPGPMLDFKGIFEFRVYFQGQTHLYHSMIPAQVNQSTEIPRLFDAGVNLFSSEFSDCLPNVISRARSSGVAQMACISVDIKTSEHSLKLAQKHVNSLFAIIGIHPTEVANVHFNDENKQKLSSLITNNKKYIAAIGECGLDLEKIQAKDNEDLEAQKEKQKEWFTYQLQLAHLNSLPVLVHSRGCHSETLAILRDYVTIHPEAVFVINCFTGNVNELKEYLDLSPHIYFVITGIITNDARGSDLREVVKKIPLDKLLLGSDAPHLTPYNIPIPKPQRNEPGFLQHTCQFIASCLNKSHHQVATATTHNAMKVFYAPDIIYSGRLASPVPALDYTQFQKLEDASAKPKSLPKLKKMELPEGMDVFPIEVNGKKVCLLVSPKEKSILSKQQGQKTAAQLLDLAEVMEIPQVPDNTQVVKGDTLLFDC